jgi:LacI family transcriptional regulator
VLVFAGSCDEDALRERELIGSFRERRVDGIILVPASPDHTYLDAERRAGTALVFVDRPARHLDADSVASDNVGGSVAAVEHLIGRGHRRVAFLGDLPSIWTADERLRGYTDALDRAGIGRDGDLIRTGLHDSDAATRAVDELLGLPDPPTALFTSQNLLTIGGLRALRSAGLQRRIALIGFDDVALGDIVEPAISVVAQDPQALGHAAAELLFRRMDGDASPSVHRVVPVTLIARGSGELEPSERAS